MPNLGTWKFRTTVEKICATANAVSLRPAKGNSPDETRKSTRYHVRLSVTCLRDNEFRLRALSDRNPMNELHVTRPAVSKGLHLASDLP
jgi:hypothetical protein